MKKISVVVLSKSAVFRMILKKILEKYPDINVINYSKNENELIEFLNNSTLYPDVAIIDGNIGKLKILPELTSKKKPIRCIIIFEESKSDPSILEKIFEYGIIDFLVLPAIITENNEKFEIELIDKIRGILSVNINAIRKKIISQQLKSKPIIDLKAIFSTKYKAVLIGISTGGPPALQEILPKFPKNFPIPIIIAQHMPPGFTKAMAERLNSICELEVVEASDGDILEKGKIFIGKGGYHIKIVKNGSIPSINLTKEPQDALYHPQIDILFESAAETLNGEVIAVIMTGMGSDGSKGLEKLKKKGAFIIAQDKETSAIFGMPKVAIEKGLVDIVVPLHKIPEEIIKKLK